MNGHWTRWIWLWMWPRSSKRSLTSQPEREPTSMAFTWRVCIIHPITGHFCLPIRMLFCIIWAVWVHLNLKPVLVTAGARWDIQGGTIAEARLKELTPSMPVIAVRAIPNDRQETRNTYECPVYKTKLRANTYIWTFSLKTRERPAKWVLAGVALLLSVWRRATLRIVG